MTMTFISNGGWDGRTGWSYERDEKGGFIIKNYEGLIMGHVARYREAESILSTVRGILTEIGEI